MDEHARDEIAAAAAAHGDLGPEYHGALAEGLVERISSEIDKQVDVRLAQYGVQPAAWTAEPTQPAQRERTARSGWANAAMGLGSVGLGVAATSVTLHAWAGTAVQRSTAIDAANNARAVAETFRMGGGVGATAIVLVAFIWVVIAVINVAYARRQAGRP
jgi:hypothetical protein